MELAFLRGKLPKRLFETLVEVAGIEPDTLCDETPVKKRGEELSSKVLSKILTEISGTDRKMLI